MARATGRAIVPRRGDLHQRFDYRRFRDHFRRSTLMGRVEEDQEFEGVVMEVPEVGEMEVPKVAEVVVPCVRLISPRVR